MAADRSGKSTEYLKHNDVVYTNRRSGVCGGLVSIGLESRNTSLLYHRAGIFLAQVLCFTHCAKDVIEKAHRGEDAEMWDNYRHIDVNPHIVTACTSTFVSMAPAVFAS
jgi:hypothetical protein